MILSTLRACGVSLGAWNTFLRLKAWFSTLLVVPVLGGLDTSVWRGWRRKLLLILRTISTTRFLLWIIIVPNTSLLLFLSCSLRLSPSTCWPWVISLKMFISSSNITFLHSVFTISDIPYRNIFIYALELETMRGAYLESLLKLIPYSWTVILPYLKFMNSWDFASLNSIGKILSKKVSLKQS